MIPRFVKFTLVLAVVIATIGFTLAAASAQTETPPATPDPKKGCVLCHPDHYLEWHAGAHGDIRAGNMQKLEMDCSSCHKDGSLGFGDSQVESSDLASQSSGQMDGSPPLCLSCHATGFDPSTGDFDAYGITCQACHGEMTADHPSGEMPINDTPELCRNCHTEARFNWTSWKSSVHFQSKMKCSTCHDPHSTNLKLVNEEVADPSILCINCHKKQSVDAQHSIHAQSGVTCVNCHLGPRKGKDDFHQVPDHSFVPTLETCNDCHANQMHDVGEALVPEIPATVVEVPTKTVTPEQSATGAPLNTTSSPAPANTVGFLAMIGFLGVIGGVVARRNIRKR